MPSLRLRFLMPVLAVIVVLAIASAAAVQRSTATTAADRGRAARALLAAMPAQETGRRGFLLTRRDTFLEPYRKGSSDYSRAYEDFHGELNGDAKALALLRTGDGLARRWHVFADEQIAAAREPGRHAFSLPLAIERKRLMDGFRAANGRPVGELDERRAADESRALWLSTGIGLFVFALVGGLGTYLVTRRMRQEAATEMAEREYRDGQAEFVETLQAVDDEAEANVVLKRHLERWVPGREVTVLNRNNSENRLEARAGAGSELAERLTGSDPRSCVAIRLGRIHEELDGEAPLLQCELCGKADVNALCSPLLVSGRVIGAVNVR